MGAPPIAGFLRFKRLNKLNAIEHTQSDFVLLVRIFRTFCFWFFLLKKKKQSLGIYLFILNIRH